MKTSHLLQFSHSKPIGSYDHCTIGYTQWLLLKATLAKGVEIQQPVRTAELADSLIRLLRPDAFRLVLENRSNSTDHLNRRVPIDRKETTILIEPCSFQLTRQTSARHVHPGDAFA